MKTIEQAADNYIRSLAPSNPNFDMIILKSERTAFIEGAKWQQHQDTKEELSPIEENSPKNYFLSDFIGHGW